METRELEVEKDGLIYKLFLPAEYMNPWASEEQKDILEIFKTLLVRVSEGEVNAVIFPSITDENGKHVFDLEVIKIPKEYE